MNRLSRHNRRVVIAQFAVLATFLASLVPAVWLPLLIIRRFFNVDFAASPGLNAETILVGAIFAFGMAAVTGSALCACFFVLVRFGLMTRDEVRDYPRSRPWRLP